VTRTKEHLNEILNIRLSSAPLAARESLRDAAEVIVFGSMAAGLDRRGSDIDVLCIGGCDYKLSSRLLDLIVVPSSSTKSRKWLGTELATHVAKYGIWIKGVPEWRDDAHVGQRTIEEKRRRISAFLGSLQLSWLKLQECFRAKYSVKLRRETQRLILLEQNVPVPPTRILDGLRLGIGQPTTEVCERLAQLSPSSAGFLQELLSRVNAHFSRGSP
jgi:predicted nucleotidyltransferase